jgi:hypothetical protein
MASTILMPGNPDVMKQYWVNGHIVSGAGHSDTGSQKLPYRAERSDQFTFRNNTWYQVEHSVYDGWYRTHLRMRRSTFNRVVDMVVDKIIETGARMPGRNAYVDNRMRIAITLEYLAGEGCFRTTANIFGISKATAIVNINEIIDILNLLIPVVVSLPSSESEWRQIADDFEDICGFPAVGGAIDGSLFEIERPFDFQGYNDVQ